MKVVPARIEGRFSSPSTSMFPMRAWKACRTGTSGVSLVGQCDRLRGRHLCIQFMVQNGHKINHPKSPPPVPPSLLPRPPPPPPRIPAFLFQSKPVQKALWLVAANHSLNLFCNQSEDFFFFFRIAVRSATFSNPWNGKRRTTLVWNLGELACLPPPPLFLDW